MSFKGFICEVSKEPVSTEECLACARNGAPKKCDMTAPIVRGFINDKRPDNFGVSVTTALGCPRQWRLKIAYDYFTKPSHEWWLFRGTALHAAAEKYAEAEGILSETRMNFLVPLGERMPKTVNDYVALAGDSVILTGKPDLVDVERGHILDFKTTKKVPLRHYAYTCPITGEVLREGKFPARYDFTCGCGETHSGKDIQSIGPPQAMSGHVWQLAIYSLMLEENGVEMYTGEIVYQSMDRQKRILIGSEKMNAAKQEVQDYLVAALPLFTQAEIPAEADVPERVKWMCEKYCPVAMECKSRPGAFVPVAEEIPQAEELEQPLRIPVSAQTAEESIMELGY
ncbi:MAG: PD-(D/E)XK nuclease family protein [Chloroflexota bacterium]|nr:PD-(D/E)XK nuclease family protein [Chloroflexota bacterium]